MVTTITVPLDGSAVAERALRPATALAGAVGAAIRLVRVVDHGGSPTASTYLERIRDAISADDGYVNGDVDGHLDCSSEVIESDWPAEAIAEAASASDSLLCISTHGSSGIRRIALGSVAEDILKMSHQPIVVVGPELADTWGISPVGGRMLVTSDGSTTAEAIIPPAREWCERLALEPWLTVVIESGGGTDFDDAALTESNYIRALAEKFEPATVNWEVLHGPRPADAIVEFARQLPAALIAISTHGRTGLARVTLGSVATQVVRNAPCPLLMSRPDDLTPTST